MKEINKNWYKTVNILCDYNSKESVVDYYANKNEIIQSNINYYLRICKLFIQAVHYGILEEMSQNQIMTMNVYLLKKLVYFDGVESDLLEKLGVKWTKIAINLVTEEPDLIAKKQRDGK